MSNANKTPISPPYFWQYNCWQTWVQWLYSSAIPHAILLSGPEGLGQLEMVHTAAQSLLCSHYNHCGHCYGCKWWQAGSHPDWLSIDAESPQDAIKIESIRSLLSFTHQTAHSSDYKVILIHRAENMTEAAANSLLKTLEEPPSDVIIFLISYQSAYLPLTIRSRCQQLHLSEPERGQVSQWLQAQAVDDPEQCARICESAPLTALAEGKSRLMAHQQILHGLTGLVQDELSPEAIFLKVNGLTLRQWFDHIQMVVIDAIRLHHDASMANLYYPQGQNELAFLSNRFTLAGLFDVYDKLCELKTLSYKAGTSLNSQMIIEQILLITSGISSKDLIMCP